MHKEAVHTIGKIALGTFVLWHMFVIGVAGVSHTLSHPIAPWLRENVYSKVSIYPMMLDQALQNWGFFGFVPNVIMSFTFSTGSGNQLTTIEEYKAADWPYMNRGTEFNFLRGLSVNEESFKVQRERYLYHYCQEHNIHNNFLIFQKKYAYLPTEESMHTFNWHMWQPSWYIVPISTVFCL